MKEASSPKTITLDAESDPFHSEDYQRFVAEAALHCHCAEAHRPCDGVLSGGICDMIPEPEPWHFSDE